MIPPLYLEALRPYRFVWLAGITALAVAQTIIPTAQNAQNTPSITKYTDINVGSVVARPFPGALLRLNSSLETRTAKGGISLGRFTLTGKKGDGWSLATSSAVPFTLTGPKGGTLRVTALTFDPSTPTTGIFPASGTTSEFSVGVTLEAGTGTKPAGPYTGSFNLSVTDTTTGRISTRIFIVRADFTTPISVSGSPVLSFGNLTVSGAAGTVVLTPENVRSATGGVRLASGGGAEPATFTVGGDAGASYTIDFPSSNIPLSGPAPGVTIGPFTSTPSGTGTLDAITGHQTVKVGGTLNVGANQASGAYSGTFSVTVAYP
jgi:hypothetical protein